MIRNAFMCIIVESSNLFLILQNPSWELIFLHQTGLPIWISGLLSSSLNVHFLCGNENSCIPLPPNVEDAMYMYISSVVKLTLPDRYQTHPQF